MFRPVVPLATVVLLALQGPAAGADAANGKALAEKHCARCHVVGAFNPHGGIGFRHSTSAAPIWPLSRSRGWSL